MTRACGVTCSAGGRYPGVVADKKENSTMQIMSVYVKGSNLLVTPRVVR